MKKLNLTLALIVFSASIYAQVKPIVDFEAGYASQMKHLYYFNSKDDSPIIKEKGMYSKLTFGLKYKNFTAKVDNFTYFIPGNKIEFSPYLSVYDIHANYKYKNFTVGLKHRCSHITKSNVISNNVALVSGSDHIYIKYTFFNN